MARDVVLERKWRERIARQGKSGLTIQAFCDREKLASHQFSWWKRELRQRDSRESRRKRPTKKAKPDNADKPSFMPVEISQVADSWPIEIVLGSPPRIIVSAGSDPQLLRDVLRALGNEPC